MILQPFPQVTGNTLDEKKTQEENLEDVPHIEELPTEVDISLTA